MSDIIETRGNFRAVVDLDAYPTEPEDDGGCPVLRIERKGWGGGTVTHTGYGQCSEYPVGFDAVDALQTFVSNHGWRDGVATFERYVRIFHDGNVKVWTGNDYRDSTYVAFVTRTLATAWGCEDVPEAGIDEWRAYCEGEVYVVAVEELVTVHSVVTNYLGETVDEDDTDEWREVESCGDYYGDEWAQQAAVEMLDAYAPKTD